MENRIKSLISKFLTNNANQQELLRLEELMQDKKNTDLFLKYVKVNVAVNRIMGKYDKEAARKIILRHIKQDKSLFRNKNKLYTWSKYAAAAIIVFGLGYFFSGNKFNSTVKTVPTIVNTNTIQPGSSKAVLTLGDNSKVVLEKGEMFQKNNIKSNGEELIYNATGPDKQKIEYNYLTIPRGGEWLIKLSDGTKVWLNSESQLKYPTGFMEGESRKVELVYGEAYFDVSPSSAHNGSKFIVHNQNQDIEVLGTEFNIKAYKDETNIYTTLVEGQVLVNKNGKKQRLLPNQQSILDKNTNSIVVIEKLNINNEISWREGVFIFDGKTLKEIMKVMSRWYDMEVVFKNKDIEDEEFVGVLRRNREIKKMLSSIKGFGAIKDYTINGKNVILE
jgi:hypothetical protein